MPISLAAAWILASSNSPELSLSKNRKALRISCSVGCGLLLTQPVNTPCKFLCIPRSQYAHLHRDRTHWWCYWSPLGLAACPKIAWPSLVTEWCGLYLEGDVARALEVELVEYFADVVEFVLLQHLVGFHLIIIYAIEGSSIFFWDHRSSGNCSCFCMSYLILTIF